MTLPTWWTPAVLPSAARLARPLGSLTSRRSATASVTIRLTSSGMARSKLRRPASTWATGMCSLTAVRAQARVELTSPTTTTRSGRSARQTFSNSTMTRAVCSAWLPEPTPRKSSGAGISSSSKKTLDMS